MEIFFPVNFTWIKNSLQISWTRKNWIPIVTSCFHINKVVSGPSLRRLTFISVPKYPFCKGCWISFSNHVKNLLNKVLTISGLTERIYDERSLFFVKACDVNWLADRKSRLIYCTKRFVILSWSEKKSSLICLKACQNRKSLSYFADALSLLTVTVAPLTRCIATL